MHPMRLLLFGFIVLAVLAFGCTGGGGSAGCASNGDCQSWQSCNATSKSCETLPGYCDAEADCGANDTLMTCDLARTHLCIFKEDRCRTNANCDIWQVCDSQQSCRAAPGYCDSDGQCNPSFEFCNPATHQCGPAPGYCTKDTDCDSWKKCDTVSRRCYMIPGRCDVDGDCENWQTCELKTHFCQPKTGFCINDGNCQNWARCDPASNKCVARQGYCGTDNECNAWEYCKTDTHRCVVQRDRCGLDSDCGSWQTCATDHFCRARVGYCNDNADCVSGEVCNQQTHLCQ